ncbi:MAG: DNA-protecting protein DprA [Flammeovirgaceae bacterium]|nr:DNA-protecting protein DprA [Flammeovirgaceae bacterium]
MDQERIAILALHFIPGVGDYLVRQLISYGGSATDIFKLPKAKLLKIPGIGEVTAKSIQEGNFFDKAEAELMKAEKDDTEIIFFIDKKYPERLRAIDDSPSMIYVKGNVNLNQPKILSIVGTRQATSYGKKMVEQIIDELIPHQPLIVSGLAYGIDIHSHKAALKNGLATLGVLGSGIDIIYPSAHRDTAMKMVNQGGLLTENIYGTKPDAHNFPSRNRIIAGLCDAVIVVEAAEKGGALITAEIANSYSRDVFAVPGNLKQTYSEGCNKLIKINKASLYTSVKDLEYLLNWSTDKADVKSKSLDMSALKDEEKLIVKFLSDKQVPAQIDELNRQTNLPASILASLLLELEFKNLIESLPGKRYKLR